MGKVFKRHWLLTIRKQKEEAKKLELEKLEESLEMEREIERRNQASELLKTSEPSKWNKGSTKTELIEVLKEYNIETSGEETKKELVVLIENYEKETKEKDKKEKV